MALQKSSDDTSDVLPLHIIRMKVFKFALPDFTPGQPDSILKKFQKRNRITLMFLQICDFIFNFILHLINPISIIYSSIISFTRSALKCHDFVNLLTKKKYKLDSFSICISSCFSLYLKLEMIRYAEEALISFFTQKLHDQ